MPSLRALLSAHAPVLVLDAASSRVQVGWFDGAAPGAADPCAAARWAEAEGESGTVLFASIAELGVSPDDAAAFMFCDGPGSILGIRTAAAAIRTWCVLRPRPVFTYSSLALVATALGPPAVGVIADARRDTWHHYTLGGTLRRIATKDLSGPLRMPEGFRHWSPLPGPVEQVPYRVRELFAQSIDADLLAVSDAPDAFLHEEPSYLTWTPQIHRAPGERGNQNV